MLIYSICFPIYSLPILRTTIMFSQKRKNKHTRRQKRSRCEFTTHVILIYGNNSKLPPWWYHDNSKVNQSFHLAQNLPPWWYYVVTLLYLQRYGLSWAQHTIHFVNAEWVVISQKNTNWNINSDAYKIIKIKYYYK